MPASPASTIHSLPAVVFQFSASRLELLNKEEPVYPGLTAAKLAKIIRGEWRSIVPAEFHPVVQKLSTLRNSGSYTTIEFPAFWTGATVWLRVFAASVSQGKGRRKIIGLVQDVTAQRLSAAEPDGLSEPSHEEEAPAWRKLRHNINGSLTSILMNCELLLDNAWQPTLRRKIESILAEAVRIDHLLQGYHE